jgi:sodium-dependent dicarboxylate transporter 2/3/5
MRLKEGKSIIKEELKALGKIGYEEKWVLLIFMLTAGAWVSRSFILKQFIPAIDDTIIALMAAILLFILPSKKKGEKLMVWKDAVKLPWGVLLLFGGGISLAIAFESSGLAEWIGNNLSALKGLPIILLLLIIVASVNFLTEVTSNLATTAILLPILAAMAIVIDVNPFLLLVAATMAASCAFMLPVATPPNAIVFGSGRLKMKDMIRSGFWLNVFSILLLTLFTYFILPWLWDFQLAG